MNIKPCDHYVVALRIAALAEQRWEISLVDRFCQRISMPVVVTWEPGALVAELAVMEERIEMGRVLAARLLVGPVLTAWQESVRQCAAAQLPLRLDLILPDHASAWDALPYEWLADETGFWFRDGLSVLVRTCTGLSSNELRLESGDRLGMIWANPGKAAADRLPPLVIDAHLLTIRQSATLLEMVAVEPCATATSETLWNYCETRQPLQVVTLLAHAKGAGGAMLLHQESKSFPNDAGEVLDSEDLQGALRAAQTGLLLAWTGSASQLRPVDPVLVRTLLAPDGGDLAMVIHVAGSVAVESGPRLAAAFLQELARSHGDPLVAVARVHGREELAGLALVCHARPGPGAVRSFARYAEDYGARLLIPEVFHVHEGSEPEESWPDVDPVALAWLGVLDLFRQGLPVGVLLPVLGEVGELAILALLRNCWVRLVADGERLMVTESGRALVRGQGELLESAWLQPLLNQCVRRFQQAKGLEDVACGQALVRADEELVLVWTRWMQSSGAGRVTPSMAEDLVRLVRDWIRLVHGQQEVMPEVLAVAQGALSVAQGVSRQAEIDAHGLLADLYHRLGRWEEAEQGYQVLLAESRRLGNRVWETEVLLELSDLYGQCARLEEAERGYQAALQLARRLCLNHELTILQALGALHGRQSRWEEAEQVWLEALSLARRDGESLSEARLLVALGRAAMRAWRHEAAKEHFLGALPLLQQCEESQGEAEVLRELGVISLRTGHPRDAETYAGLARSRFQQLGDRAGEADVLELSGQIHLAERRDVEAVQARRDCRTLRRQLRVEQAVRWRSLVVRDFRGIEALTLDWSAERIPWMVVAGASGSGKSAVLEALLMLVWAVTRHRELSSLQEMVWSDRLIRLGCRQARINGVVQVKEQTYAVGLVVQRTGGWSLEGDVEPLARLWQESAGLAHPGCVFEAEAPLWIGDCLYVPAARRMIPGAVSLGAVMADGEAAPGVDRFKRLALRALLGSTGQFAELDPLEARDAVQQLDALLLKHTGYVLDAVRSRPGHALELWVKSGSVQGSMPFDALSFGQRDLVGLLFQIWHATRHTPLLVMVDGVGVQSLLDHLMSGMPDNRYLVTTGSKSLVEWVAARGGVTLTLTR
ncbi:MAG: hypothetical protein G8237_11995 [Magnetococcales bacterium]|nr:hypothetical protein [Magnetococcales bacterium]NGZ07065.1 hypothetical protein [Magnetococcales bacterium]